MSTITAPTCAPLELCSRSADGIEVALLWSPDSDRLTVAVVDTKLNSSFQLEPAAHEARDVFEHPYAWAASLARSCAV
jgi:hypothetical protein